ncbi:hypothetical protein V6Z11_A04G039200 [Gossypium hirsutum]
MSSMRSHKLVLFFAISCLLFQEKCTYASVCKESERKVLLEFKHSLQAMGFSSDNALSSWISEDFTGYIEMLDFSYQSLVIAGTISPSLLKLHHLTSLNFSGILDSLAYWFWDSSYSSMYINMSFNQINGTFPNNSIPIRLLDLSSNNFSRPLPHFSLNLGNMGTINLSKNKFTGSVSPIFNITNKGILKLIDLSNNLFSRVVPDCFESFQSLTALNLGDNRELPSSLQNCTRLKFLDLSDNELSGEIPIWIGQRLSSLVFLSLQGNQFRGRIPHQLCGLKYLQILDLSINKISGTIPPCLNNLTSMQKKKKGTKQSYPQLGLLLAVDLSSNKLTGEVSEELNSLQELVALNLSRNIFSRKVLDLSRNKFSGNIPTSLFKLTFLSTLDFSYNDLSGKIPTSTQLQNFDPSSFSHNRGLCGPPVSPNCSMVEPSPGKHAVGGEEDSDEFMKWFYTGMGLGFTMGFWGVL